MHTLIHAYPPTHTIYTNTHSTTHIPTSHRHMPYRYTDTHHTHSYTHTIDIQTHTHSGPEDESPTDDKKQGRRGLPGQDEVGTAAPGEGLGTILHSPAMPVPPTSLVILGTTQPLSGPARLHSSHFLNGSASACGLLETWAWPEVWASVPHPPAVLGPPPFGSSLPHLRRSSTPGKLAHRWQGTSSGQMSVTGVLE